MMGIHLNIIHIRDWLDHWQYKRSGIYIFIALLFHLSERFLIMFSQAFVFLIVEIMLSF